MALKKLLAGSIVLTSLWGAGAQATLNIEITKSLGTAFPVAIVPFQGQRFLPAAQKVSDVVQADLVHSGRFSEIPPGEFLSHPHHAADVIFKDWRLVKADALVIGSIQPTGGGLFNVTFRLYDVFSKKQLAAFRYRVGTTGLRQVAHEISDVVYQKLLGIPGAFNTRIAYVGRQALGGHRFIYRLQVADYDGYHPQTILKSAAPIVSPAWSPHGHRIAYVSFERGRSVVYVENVDTGRRRLIANYAGLNGAPAWAPDGIHLALMLVRAGNPEIYVLNLQTNRLRRLTHDPAIDTEPTWSPHGNHIAFTSDRSGNPQIYLMNRAGENVRRLTFSGRYNAAACYAPDGKHLAIVSRQGGAYHIALLSIKDSSLTPLTDTRFDESPSFAPNGQTILYDTLVGGRRVLATVSIDGNFRQVIRLPGEDVSNPAWSPYNQSNQMQLGE
ncbi:MAG TPA: Tol-Pal system beta propeller repeat protein TolB [Acidiferrobacteraceae bacterium]|nr:Tol-Pal system beta propeller repeat protein TolB [Acidiferrobacteraceae bacterium]